MKEPTQTGQRAETGMGTALVARSGEMALTASAARAKAEIEAAYVMAMHNPRNIEDARLKILEACRRPRFAETAIYSKPVGGGKTAKGLSIRAAETVILCLGNIRIDTSLVYEDENVRVIQVSISDVQSNLTYGRSATLSKTVERARPMPGRQLLGERINTRGETSYLYAATEDEMLQKEASARSKIIRTEGLRLAPADILEEMMDLCLETQRSGGGDPKAAHKKIGDAFAGLGIMPSDLERYLGCKLTQANVSQIDELRGIFAAIKDGEARWTDYLAAGPAPARATVDIDQIKAGDPETHTEPGDPIIPLVVPEEVEPTPPMDDVTEQETPSAIWNNFLAYVQANSLKDAEAIYAAEDLFLKEWDTKDPSTMPPHFVEDLRHWITKKLVPRLKKDGMIKK